MSFKEFTHELSVNAHDTLIAGLHRLTIHDLMVFFNKKNIFGFDVIYHLIFSSSFTRASADSGNLTMELLTDQLVTNIMDEVTGRTNEKPEPPQQLLNGCGQVSKLYLRNLNF